MRVTEYLKELIKMDQGTVARVFSCCRYLNGVLPSAYCRFYFGL